MFVLWQQTKVFIKNFFINLDYLDISAPLSVYQLKLYCHVTNNYLLMQGSPHCIKEIDDMQIKILIKINIPCSAWTVWKLYLSSFNICLNTVRDLVLALTSVKFRGDVYCLLNVFQYLNIVNISLAKILEPSLFALQRNFTI